MQPYTPMENRYQSISYNRCGKSGLKLPVVSLGLWHNFGSVDIYENCRNIIHTAFDLGITHFDLANNYGPEPGSAEITFGKIFHQDLKNYRDEIIVSSKAGYLMWPGPYGEWGSRKNLIASCDQSLKRLNLDYVDIFYSHRLDPDTPLEETMMALDHIVRSGRALYAGISNYTPEATIKAAAILRELKTPCLIHQIRFNILDRRNLDNSCLKTNEANGMGTIVFSPLAQGLLTNRYLNGNIPQDSRASRNHFLKPETITPQLLNKIQALNLIAQNRNQTLAQMAIAWVLNQSGVTSALIGASRKEQVIDIISGLGNLSFTPAEKTAIDNITRNRY